MPNLNMLAGAALTPGGVTSGLSDLTRALVEGPQRARQMQMEQANRVAQQMFRQKQMEQQAQFHQDEMDQKDAGLSQALDIAKMQNQTAKDHWDRYAQVRAQNQKTALLHQRMVDPYITESHVDQFGQEHKKSRLKTPAEIKAERATRQALLGNQDDESDDGMDPTGAADPTGGMPPGIIRNMTDQGRLNAGVSMPPPDVNPLAAKLAGPMAAPAHAPTAPGNDDAALEAQLMQDPGYAAASKNPRFNRAAALAAARAQMSQQ